MDQQDLLTPEGVRGLVAEKWGVTVDGLTSRRRTKNLTVPRQVAMYLMRDLLELPLVEIGRHFGGRDHSTVIHSVQKVENSIEGDTFMRDRVDELRRELLA